LVNGVQLGIAQPWLRLDPGALGYAWPMHRLAHSWIDFSCEGAPTALDTPPRPG